jgi:hypothetical protein
MYPDEPDDSTFGGDSTPNVMDPGPQPAPEQDQTPELDDPSKQGSG